MIRVCIALTMLLAALPATAFSQSSKSFSCVEGQHILPDALDIRDNEHALAVMRRHPELKNLPGYLDESVEGDYIENTKTPGGRRALVIVLVVDSSDPQTGAETLSKAKAEVAPFVEDVGVRVIGGGGVYLLGPVIFSDITQPTGEHNAKGIVRIVTSVASMVSWISVHIDDSYLAASQPSSEQYLVRDVCAEWNSRTVPNGPHTISVKAYGSDMREIEQGESQVTVTVAN